MIALVDCNSFYASCEQVFRPDLWGRPVVVLSNNDGCIIAANKEAKTLPGITLFEPVYKIKKMLLDNSVTLFSSNYAFYGDMSQRVVNTLRNFSPHLEVYSIDECFLDFSSMKIPNYTTYGHQIKETVYRHTGLPVGVGIAPTKALVKVANRIAKKYSRQLNNVYVIDNEEKRIKALKWIEVDDLWGIGRKHSKRLKNVGAYTGYDFTQLPPTWVKNNMSVVGLRLWKELRGIPCLLLQETIQTKKNIGTAKSFGQKLESLDLIEEACAYYISEVAEVLRAQKSCANYLTVFLHTNYFSQVDQQYSNSITLTLPVATNSSFELIKWAQQGLSQIYKKGYRYKKVGVCLSGIIPQNYVQGNLFAPPPHNWQPLLKVFDKINFKYGKSTVYSGLCGSRKREWQLICNMRSPRYTTQWKELPVLRPKTTSAQVRQSPITETLKR